MKKNLLFSLIALIGLSSFVLAKKVKSPPGTIQIGENLFVDRSEISNQSWKEFAFWNERTFGKESKDHLESMPNTGVWADKVLQEKYYLHPAYDDYPVVGISHQQAKDYCSWRSDRVNEMLYIKTNKKEALKNNSNNVFPEVYKYRLPAESEWEQVANIAYSDKDRKKFQKQQKQYMRLTNDAIADAQPDGEITYITSPVETMLPNEKGIYHLIGNVSEFVAEEGIVKGGSWRHKEADVSVEQSFSYDKPADWIGFRCICEKINE